MSNPNKPSDELRQTIKPDELERTLSTGPEVLSKDLATQLEFVSALIDTDAAMLDSTHLHPDAADLPVTAIHMSYADPATTAVGFRYEAKVLSGGMLTQLDPVQGIIHAIFTSPGFEHLGMAHGVMAKLLQVAADEGLVVLQLKVHPYNEDARRIYERAGFTTDGLVQRDGTIKYWLLGNEIYRGIGRLTLRGRP